MVKAKLIIDGKEINVLWFTFGFNQGADRSGRPSQRPVFTGLKLIIETRKDLNLADWSFAPNQTKQLELHIYPVIMGGKTRKLYFYDCHLVNWKNAFSSTGSNPMSETLEITCAGVEDSTSEAVYSAYWRKTFKEDNVEATTLDNTEEEIIDCYLTDLENNENPDLELENEVYLVIKTENMAGKTKDIDISNFKKTFEYQGEIIEDNTINSFNIKSDLQKVKLKIVNTQDKKIALDD